MSKTVINKREQLKWNNGFDPNGKSIPDITESDEGKFIKVVDGVLAFGEGGGSGSTYTAGDNIQISADNVISATDTTYTAGDNVAISADNEISSVNTIVFNAKYFRDSDTFQYDDTAIAPFLTEVYKNDKRAIVRVQDANYNIYDIYTLIRYESTNNNATFTKSNPIIVSANQREIVCAYIKLSVSNNVGTLTFTSTGVTDLPEGATAGQIPISDGHSGWIAGNIPTELPSVSSSDEGKVLKVDSNGDWAVGTDNDTTYTAGTNVSISAQNVISATDTTYSAGEGIDITAQVVSSPDAVMAKEGIADEYEGLTFYPIATSASTNMNMEADCMVAMDCPFDRVAGVRVYSTNGVNGYWCVKKDNGGARLLVFVPGATGQVTIRSQHIDSFGEIDDNEMLLYRVFSGSVNSGYYGDTTVNPFGDGDYPLVECAYDLTNCTYASDSDAIDEFGNNPIPTGENYNEGDQVWKNGKLQTYTSGSWVDSDTIVEQIANASEKELPTISSAERGKVLAVSSNSNDVVWEDSTIVYTVTYDSGTDTYSLPSGVTYSSISSLLSKGKTIELLYDNKRHRCSSVTSGQIDFDSTIGGMAGLVGNSTIRVKSNNTVTVNVTYSMPMKDTSNRIYRFDWTADSSGTQDYTATQDCFVVVNLIGVSGESGAANELGINYSILIGTTSSNVSRVAHGRFTTMSGANPEYAETFFLRKGWVISVRHFIRNTSSTSSFEVYPVK